MGLQYGNCANKWKDKPRLSNNVDKSPLGGVISNNIDL